MIFVQHNMIAANTAGKLNITTGKQAKSSEKLSSGYKINRSADDAAGLSISEKMRWMVRGLNQASKNAADGVSLLNVADGALGESESIIQRIRELAVQAANDTNTATDREAILQEITQLTVEVDRIAETTEFNTMKLLDGSLADASLVGVAPLSSDSVQFSTDISGLQRVSDIIQTDPVIAATATGKITTTQATKLSDTLVNTIVPNAVDSFLSTFPALNSAFSNGQLSNEIGLNIYCDSSTTLAFVSQKYGYYSDKSLAASYFQLNLSVNVNTLSFTGDELTADSRSALETTIVHEMMHAFMDDLLTNGMVGATNGVLDADNAFPKWFTEGMAQTAAGGCSNSNDWVNIGLGLNASSTPAQITSSVTSPANNLGSDSTASRYGTGYLACMYLGYMASGSGAVNGGSLTSGVNSVISRLAGGECLDDVITGISGGKYTSTEDFQNKFGDTDSANFIQQLLGKVGSSGNGGLIGNGGGDVLERSDSVSDSAGTPHSPYKVDDTREYVPSSITETGRNWGSGGKGKKGSNNTGQDAYTPPAGGGPIYDGETVHSGGLNLQVSSLAYQAISISIGDMHTKSLGLTELSVDSFHHAGQTIEKCDHALEILNKQRSSLGAITNRLEHTIANVDNISENTQAAESRVRDTDIAAEMVEFSKNNILAQAGQSMLTQANQMTQSVLTLLQ